ncbi:MAG: hypothetical protein AB3X44_09735 [Leptothrix sp. (in: b-proteobacteria)]
MAPSGVVSSRVPAAADPAGWCFLCLKHLHNESDKSVEERWSQDAFVQFFGGNEFLCDPDQSSASGWWLGEAGVGAVAQDEDIEATVVMQAIKKADLAYVTAQQQAIQSPAGRGWCGRSPCEPGKDVQLRAEADFRAGAYPPSISSRSCGASPNGRNYLCRPLCHGWSGH